LLVNKHGSDLHSDILIAFYALVAEQK